MRKASKREFIDCSQSQTMEKETWAARAHVMIWHGTHTVTIPVQIAREMALKRGDAVDITITKAHEGKISGGDQDLV